MAGTGRAGRKRAGEPERRKPEEVRQAAEGYFAGCDEAGTLYGEAGLALALGVTLHTLQGWYDGGAGPELQREARMAYLRIQNQIETDPRYREKGMVTRSIFLSKQPRLGGYGEKPEAKQEIAVNVKLGDGMDPTDFQ